MSRLTVALDCDGVLADFDASVRKLANNSQRSWLTRLLKPVRDETLPLDDLFGSTQGMWEAIEEAGYDFHKNMPVIAGAIDAVHELRKDHDVICVTSPPATVSHWLRLRTSWLRDHFMFKRDEIIFTPGKHYIRADVLVDDLPKNLAQWPGMRVLVSQPWNRGNTIPEGTMTVASMSEVPSILKAAASVR